MKRFIFSLSFSLFALLIYGQITLEECQRKTRENYPLVRQYGLIEKTKEYNLANASKANLPQFTLSGKRGVEGRQVFPEYLAAAGSRQLAAHQALARRNTYRRRGIGVIKYDAVFCQTVQVRGPDHCVSCETR